MTAPQINLTLLHTLTARFRRDEKLHLQLAGMSGQRSDNCKRSLDALVAGGHLNDNFDVTESGLAALAAAGLAPDTANTAAQIDHAAIAPNPFNPRKTFDEDSLRQFADSIEANGLLQPILVRPAPSGVGYELIAGERRWRATGLLIEEKRAANAQINAIVRDMTDKQAFAASIAENADREDVSIVQEGRALAEAIARGLGTKDQIAKQLGKTTRYVEIRIGIGTKLSGPAADALERGQITQRMARTLYSHDARLQDAAIKAITSGSYNAPSDDESLKQWIDRQGYQLKHMLFTREDFEAASTDDADCYVSNGLCIPAGIAKNLQREYAEKEAETRAQAAGLEGGGICPHSYWAGAYEDRTDGDDTQTPHLCIVAKIDFETAKADFIGPVVNLQAWRRPNATATPEAIADQQERARDDTGLKIATRMTARNIKPDIAMAIATLAMLNNDEDNLPYFGDHDCRQLFKGDQALFENLVGFSFDEDDGFEVEDESLALRSLVDNPDTCRQIFTRALAETMTDHYHVRWVDDRFAIWDTITRATGPAQLSEDDRAALLVNYDLDSLKALIADHAPDTQNMGALDNLDPEERARIVAKYLPDTWLPPEADFTKLAEKEAAERAKSDEQE